MTILEEILQITSEDYKKRPYADFCKIVDEVLLFRRKHKGKSFLFEIHAHEVANQEIKVMVECKPKCFLCIWGRHHYFTVNPDGAVNDIDGEEYWE